MPVPVSTIADARATSILQTLQTPADLRQVDPGQLRQIADELRTETINAVAVTGGHLGASLGVIELTVALHYVFDTPRDKVIWDVGHQAYPHKILTGRRDRIRTLRQSGGLSGFTKRAESEYDPFGAAHSSTSISAGLGMATARDLSGADFYSATFDHVTIDACSLRTARFHAATIKCLTITGCDMTGLVGALDLKGAVIDLDDLQSLAPSLASEAGIELTD